MAEFRIIQLFALMRFCFCFRPELINTNNTAAIRVYFKEVSCVKYRRDVILTWDGLFASFGGIFGLCLGGSLISLIEFVYYFTFHLFNATVTAPERKPLGRNHVKDVTTISKLDGKIVDSPIRKKMSVPYTN